MNVAVGKNFDKGTEYIFFYDQAHGLKCWLENWPIHYSQQTLLPNLLVELGLFKSTSDAMRAGHKGEIPKGYTVIYRVKSGGRTHGLTIYNPEKKYRFGFFEKIGFYFRNWQWKRRKCCPKLERYWPEHLLNLVNPKD